MTAVAEAVHDRPAGAARIVMCWPEISGYMAHCWRKLALQPDVDLHVVAYDSARETDFALSTMQGISWTALSQTQRHDRDVVRDIVVGKKPDLIVLPGWLNPAYSSLTRCRALSGVPFLMTMDTPWRGTTRQQIGRLILRRYLTKIHSVAVPGERSWQFAIRLGFPEARISRCLYGIDHEGLSILHAERSAAGWPETFAYVGRYASEKGFDLLLEAYRRYRQTTLDPWPLTCCGMGPLKGRLASQQGVTDLGFVQPSELREVLRNAAIFVLPSLMDPWPLALVEACAAGLPVIATNACGSSVECLHDRYNGRIVPTDDAGALAEALTWAQRSASRLPEMGRRSLELSAPYSGSLWARHWSALISDVLRQENDL